MYIAENNIRRTFWVQIGFFMDTTEIFLNRLASAEDVYTSIASAIECDILDSKNALEAYLNEVTEASYKIYISSEKNNNSPADEALECFIRAAEGNSNIKVDTVEDEFLNLVDDNDRITKQSYPRSYVHRKGLLHPTVHIWFIRRRDMGINVLLQKRAHEKDICPDCYDVSAAGHVTQGGEFRHTALREIHEELGIEIPQNKLEFIGIRHNTHDEGNIHDSELVAVYIYRGDIHKADLTLQESEVSEVCWAEIDEIICLMKQGRINCCVSLDEFKMIKKALY